MQAPGDVIADVRRWYATNGQRPVKTRTKTREEKQLANKWNSLLINKSTLSAECLAEAEYLEAQFETGVDQLAAWVEEHKRHPRQKRAHDEGRLAHKWWPSSKDSSSLPPSSQQIVMAMKHRLLSDPARIEAERIEDALLGARKVDIYVALKTWMESHKRHPRRGRVEEEGRMARKWYHLRSLEPSSLPPTVRDGLARLRAQLGTDPSWLAAEAAEDALQAGSHRTIYAAVEEWMESHKRHPRWGRVGEEGRMARKWYHLRSLEPSSLPTTVRDGLVKLRVQLVTDPAWLETEAVVGLARHAQCGRKRRGSNCVLLVSASRRMTSAYKAASSD